MIFTPHDYQVQAVEFIKDNAASAIFADCGLGKTAIVLTAIDYLIRDLDCKGVLIVAPLRVTRLTWPLEIEKWAHTNWMSYVVLHGKDKKKNLLKKNVQVYIINYEGLDFLISELKAMKPADWPFDTIVFDELTKMKCHSTKRFKAMKKILPHFNRRIGLTGTPAPNSLQDLYAQMFVLDLGESLGTSVTRFRDRFFIKGYDGWTYTIREGADKQIHELISKTSLRISAKDHLDLLPCIYTDIDLTLPTDCRKQYKYLEKNMFLELENTEIEAFNAAALTNKCLQFAGGGVYTEDKGEWELIHDVKIKALKKLVKKEKGNPLIVVYTFKHELERILEEFPNAKRFKSGVSVEFEQKMLEDWDNGKIDMLVCHPASLGHGVNLQRGGHIVVWFTLNWSLELYIQLNCRVNRQGQNTAPVIYRMIMRDTVDELVSYALEEKDNRQNALLNALKKYKENMCT